jgi:hypothetical protein
MYECFNNTYLLRRYFALRFFVFFFLFRRYGKVACEFSTPCNFKKSREGEKHYKMCE